MHIRPIESRDNAAVARIIRSVMTEYGAVGTGFSILDPEVDDMYGFAQKQGVVFFVLEEEEAVYGCAGIAPLKGADPSVCELQKMYFLPEARGRGWGREMLQTCLGAARLLGYQLCYLETLHSMKEAGRLYLAAGFSPASGPMGNTGHSSCNAFYTLKL